MSEVCWYCYLLYNQERFVGSLWQQRCLDQDHQGGNLVHVRYHYESGTSILIFSNIYYLYMYM